MGATVQLPARFGKYELEEFLGGGMSHVYRARDLLIGRTVAVKILTDAGCADAEAKARFLAEARMAGNISHENILGIYEFGEDEYQRPFIVMEFLRGEDLRHAIDNGHLGDLRQKLKIALQVARALEYIHSLKIVHRDIKPENVHVNASGVAKLIDFGIAKAENLQLTRAGYVLGTPTYMAPEQVTGQQVTGQADIYAFGLLLYELLSGVKPVSGETMERLFYCILNEPLNLEPLSRSDAPQTVRELVTRCTAKNPRERPQGFGPVCAVLEQSIAEIERPPVAPVAPVGPPVEKTPIPRSWLLAAVLPAVILLAAGLYFILGRKSEALPKTISSATGEMVLVPAGEFEFGEKKERIALPDFYIDKMEVSNAMYAEFCRQTKRPLPDRFPTDKKNYPVVNVTILNARDFAHWAGKRLPSAREWEKAARGADGRQYPWGNQADLSRANVGSKELQPVDSLAAGASPYAALNMVGNAWEFVEQLSTPGPKAVEFFGKALNPPPGPDETWFAIRGQSFRQPTMAENVIWDSFAVPARWKYLDIGFRCVKDAH